MKLVIFILALGFGVFAHGSNHDLDSNDLGSNYHRAIEEFNHFDYATALPRFKSLSKEDNKDTDLLFYLARTQFGVGDNKSARTTIEALIDLSSNHIEAHNFAGTVYMTLLNEVSVFKKLAMAKAATASWEKVVELDDQHVQGNYALFSYYLNAPGFAGGDTKKAESILKKLETISPAFAEMAHGMSSAKNEKFEEAEQHYLNASEMIKDRASPHFAIAQFYYRNEDFEKSLAALTRYQKAEKIWQDPGEAMTLYPLGTVNSKLGNLALSRENFRNALPAYPNKRIKGLINDGLKDL